MPVKKWLLQEYGRKMAEYRAFEFYIIDSTDSHKCTRSFFAPLRHFEEISVRISQGMPQDTGAIESDIFVSINCTEVFALACQDPYQSS